MSDASITQAPILDLYAPLNHKSLLAGPGSSGTKFHAPSWVGKEHLRRLDAYRILQAYCDNNARYFLAADPKTKADQREYGDAATLVATIKAALLGESQTIVVAGSEAFEESLPDDATPEQQQRNDEAARSVAREELLRKWATDERILIKLNGAETKAGRLGDCVYELSWSKSKGRPLLRTYDPGFYFPVLGDDDNEYPKRVHLAWAFEDSARPTKILVHRRTFELGPIQAPTDESGFSIVTEDGPLEPANATFSEGRYLRSLPWNEEPTSLTCYLTDAVWEIELGKHTVEDFNGARAEYTLSEDGIPLRRLDLGIDFIPIVHVPNTAEEEEHFGASSLLVVAQLLDQINSCESDLGNTASTSATPVIGLEGGNEAQGSASIQWGPGAVISNPNGAVKLLHTADALEPLSEYGDRLLDRLSVNGRAPASAMGRVDSSKVESGIHLALSWGPLRSLVAEMRLVRHEKYSLLLKFVQRYFLIEGKIPQGEEILDAELVFGNFLPTDLAGAVTNVTSLLKERAISKRTAITMLVEAGLPIDDANEELERIEQDERQRNALMDPAAWLQTLGNVEALAELIGVEIAPLEPTLPEGA